MANRSSFLRTLRDIGKAFHTEAAVPAHQGSSQQSPNAFDHVVLRKEINLFLAHTTNILIKYLHDVCDLLLICILIRLHPFT